MRYLIIDRFSIHSRYSLPRQSHNISIGCKGSPHAVQSQSFGGCTLSSVAIDTVSPHPLPVQSEKRFITLRILQGTWTMEKSAIRASLYSLKNIFASKVSADAVGASLCLDPLNEAYRLFHYLRISKFVFWYAQHTHHFGKHRDPSSKIYSTPH